MDVNGVLNLTIQSATRDDGLLASFRRDPVEAMLLATQRGVKQARELAAESAAKGEATRLEIRGRVRILEPVRNTRRNNVAIVKRSSRAGIEGVSQHYDAQRRVHSDQYHAYGEAVEHVTQCGRFVIDDGETQALIDDDAIDVWVLDGCAEPSGDEWSLGALNGDEIIVIGPGERKVGVDWMVREQSTGYRESPTGFQFAGRPDDRIYVLVPYP